jgi:excisionase family DNA binding protein
LSLREAAEQAGTSKSTIRRAIKSGRTSAAAAGQWRARLA